jgi:hypothetical protein
MVCSECFKNEGLRLEARKLGKFRTGTCGHCGSQEGVSLNGDQCAELIYSFFVKGAVGLASWGLSPYKSGFVGNPHNLHFDPTLEPDFQLLLSVPELGLGYHSPRTWKVGDTRHFDLFSEIISRKSNGQPLTDQDNAVLDETLHRCRRFTLPNGTRFYRIRTDPETPSNHGQYDSPPPEKGKPTRFSPGHIPILYGAFDIDTCIHEGRCTVYHEICLATIETLIDLEAIDLGDASYDSSADTPWTSPSIFLSQILRRPAHQECQILAERIFAKGILAIQFPSFFSCIRDQQYNNIAILGRPVEEGKVHVASLNRIRLDRIDYSFTCGPVEWMR